MQSLPNIKRGDTFILVCTLTDDNGSPIEGISKLLRSEIRDAKDKLIAELHITATEIPGEYQLKAIDTSCWPTDEYLYMDIQYSDIGVVSSSEIIRMIVDKDVTR